MRVKYFVGSDTSGASETFLRKSIDDMKAAGWKVTLISGRKEGGNDSTIYSGFTSSGLLLQLLKLFSFLLFTKHKDLYQKWDLRIRQRIALHRLRNHVCEDCDLYWFDYLHYACYAEKALKRVSVPYVIAVHGFDASQHLANPYVAQSARALSPVFFISPSNHLKRRLALVDVQSPIHVVPYDSAPSRRQPGTVEYDFIALGRMTEKKCPAATLLAFERIVIERPKAKLIWVGTGPLEAAMKIRYSALVDSGNLEFCGALPQNEAMEILSKSKIFVQHSVTSSNGDQEGLPNAIIEAMRFGLPIVSTFHSGIPEIVENGETGFLVPEFDFESFSRFMLVLMDDADLRENLGMNGKRRIRRLIPEGSRFKQIQKLLSQEV